VVPPAQSKVFQICETLADTLPDETSRTLEVVHGFPSLRAHLAPVNGKNLGGGDEAMLPKLIIVVGATLFWYSGSESNEHMSPGTNCF
jgi:hypothetical protein